MPLKLQQQQHNVGHNNDFGDNMVYSGERVKPLCAMEAGCSSPALSGEWTNAFIRMRTDSAEYRQWESELPAIRQAYDDYSDACLDWFWRCPLYQKDQAAEAFAQPGQE